MSISISKFHIKIISLNHFYLLKLSRERSLAYFLGIDQSNVLTMVESEAGTELRRILQIL